MDWFLCKGLCKGLFLGFIFHFSSHTSVHNGSQNCCWLLGYKAPFGLCCISPTHTHTSVMATIPHENTVLRTMQENSSNCQACFQAFSVQDIHIFSLYLRQVYVQSNAAQHAPRQLKVKSSIKYYILHSAVSLILQFFPDRVYL